MTSSDAIMLAQLSATLLLASSVAFIAIIRSGVPQHWLTKVNAYASLISLGVSVIFTLLIAAFADQLPEASAVFAYVVLIAGTVTTVAALWGQLDAVYASRRPQDD